MEQHELALPFHELSGAAPLLSVRMVKEYSYCPPGLAYLEWEQGEWAESDDAVEDQIRRECRERGLPEPVDMTRMKDMRVAGRARRPVHFRRFRNKRGLEQPDRQGSFWRLTFPEPVDGPLALGFACHFGLGLFKSGHSIEEDEE